MSARGPPPRGPPGGGGPPRGPPPRGPPGGGPPRGAPPRGPPGGGGGPPRGPPGGGPPRGAPPRGPPGGGPPGRGPPPRGPPGGGGPPGRGPPGGGGPPGRGPPGGGGPPRGPPGGPPRGGPPRGPPSGGGPPRGPPGGPPRGPPGGPPRGPPRGPPSGPPRSGPPTAAPPAGMPRGPPGGGGPPGRGAPPRGPPGGGPRGPAPGGPPPRGPGAPGPPPRAPPPPKTQPNQNIAPPSAPSAPKFGRLMVKCLKGIDLKAGQGMFGKADPYAKLRVGTQEYSTKHNAGGGKNPVWNEEFGFDISNEKQIDMEVLDKETVGNDKFMGRCTYSIMEWIASGKFDGDLELQDKAGKMVGRVTISVRFERPKGPGTQESTDALDKEIMSALVVKDDNNPVQGLNQPPRDPNGKFTDEEIYEAFKAFDLDKNNFIGAAEIRHILINIGEQVSDEEVDEMIRMVDKDGDGQVSWDEFYAMVTGGKKPPSGFGGGGGDKAAAGAVVVPTGQNVVQARNAKKTALEEFAKDNNLKPESVKKAYKRFQAADKDKSGLIDYTEFCEILQVDPSPQCEGVFQLYDYDKTGQIDAREFLIAVSNYTGAGKEDKLKFAFMAFDGEGNGVITKAELLKILKANHMASHDVEVARKADTIMSQADKDGDGVITFDEFVVVSKKFPNILFPAYQSK